MNAAEVGVNELDYQVGKIDHEERVVDHGATTGAVGGAMAGGAAAFPVSLYFGPFAPLVVAAAAVGGGTLGRAGGKSGTSAAYKMENAIRSAVGAPSLKEDTGTPVMEYVFPQLYKLPPEKATAEFERDLKEHPERYDLQGETAAERRMRINRVRTKQFWKRRQREGQLDARVGVGQDVDLVGHVNAAHDAEWHTRRDFLLRYQPTNADLKPGGRYYDPRAKFGPMKAEPSGNGADTTSTTDGNGGMADFAGAQQEVQDSLHYGPDHHLSYTGKTLRNVPKEAKVDSKDDDPVEPTTDELPPETVNTEPDRSTRAHHERRHYHDAPNPIVAALVAAATGVTPPAPEPQPIMPSLNSQAHFMNDPTPSPRTRPQHQSTPNAPTVAATPTQTIDAKDQLLAGTVDWELVAHIRELLDHNQSLR
jgi:hypothetical protein